MSVFRKQSTRPVPANATITTKGKKEFARWKGRGAKTKWITSEVHTLSDGRKVIRQLSATWFARYRDHAGVVHVVSTKCKDESNAQAVLAGHERRQERIRAGVLSPAEDAASEYQNQSFDDCVSEYTRTLRGTHAKTTERYIISLSIALKWHRLSDMKRSDLEGWLADAMVSGRGARSRNAYLTAITSFGNWLVKNNRWLINQFAKMPHANLDADHRRQRRALTQLELACLMNSARSTPGRPRCTRIRVDGQSVARPADRLSGDDRAELYAFLAGTGLRVNECRQLTVAYLELVSTVPVVRLSAHTTKNGKEACIPLRRDLVEMLIHRIQRLSLHDNDPVFQIPAGLLKRFHADCKRAGIPKRDARGRQVDLHALRTTFGTSLARAGVPMRTAQQLMRHSDINLTAKIYVDPALLDLQGAVEAIGAPCVAQLLGHTSPQESLVDEPSAAKNLLKFG